MLEHPDITHVNRTGHYPYSEPRQELGVDPLGNQVHAGDEILVYEDEFFLVDTLLQESIEILERIGATYETAK